MLSSLLLIPALVCAQGFASPVLRRQAPSFVFDGDAPFSVDDETLAAALTCPNGAPSQSSPPVLLVHGTAVTGDATWGEGYVPALLADGYTACHVTLRESCNLDRGKGSIVLMSLTSRTGHG
jgi:hypothetical protein